MTFNHEKRVGNNLAINLKDLN